MQRHSEAVARQFAVVTHVSEVPVIESSQAHILVELEIEGRTKSEQELARKV